MIYLNSEDKKPLYEQLYEALKKEIVAGNYAKDTALGSLRTMGDELLVSRNTVDRAYQQLLAEGYIRSVPGAGYFVEDIENDYFNDFITVTKKTEHKSQKAIKQELKYDFEYSSIDSELFPWNKWRKYVQDAIMMESGCDSISYDSNKGCACLRASLCGFLNRHRGVNCKPEQIIITAGTQYAMEIVTNLLPVKSTRIAYEEPGYDAMRCLLEDRGYSVTSVQVEEHGIDVDFLAKTNCNLLYITPSHQFPTGTVTSISNRNKMLKWAYKNDAYIIENDYDSEFRYGMMQIPSLQSLDKYQKVIYMGTVSKVLSPSTRCAYLVLPEALLGLYDEKYRYFNSSLPGYHQSALAKFINDGLLEKHIRKVSKTNEKKYMALIKSIKDYLSDDVEIFQQPAGVHTIVRFVHCRDQDALIKKMKEASIGIYEMKVYWHDKKKAREDIFLIGFNSMSEEEICCGCKCIAKVLSDNRIGANNKV